MAEPTSRPSLVGDPGEILHASLRVPQHVVYRPLAEETVVLNLETGQYHGLNLSAGRMLETLDKFGSCSQAAAVLAEEFGEPLAQIEDDLTKFCLALLDRGLIAIDDRPRKPR